MFDETDVSTERHIAKLIKKSSAPDNLRLRNLVIKHNLGKKKNNLVYVNPNNID